MVVGSGSNARTLVDITRQILFVTEELGMARKHCCEIDLPIFLTLLEEPGGVVT